jgi:hypothetical protein
MITPWQASAVFPCVAAVELLYWLAWGASLVLSVTLVILMWTRWGQSRPLQKCAALSLLVHLVLAFLTMTVRIVTGDGGGGGGGGTPIRVRIVQENGSNSKLTTVAANTDAAIAAPELLEAPPEPVDAGKLDHKADAAEDKPEAANVEAELSPPELATAKLSPNGAAKSAPLLTEQSTKPTSVEKKADEPSPQTAAKETKPTEKPPASTQTPSDLVNKQAPSAPATQTATDTYSLRNASDRLSLIEGQGGNAKTEGAVVAALNWLVSAQSNDGRWDANQFGAGQEQIVLGQNRGGAGRNADTGVSALALLAFMGAGHSHLQGEYRDSVRRGLDFLLRSQADDGSLFGNSTLYAQMYCHSMATFALAEAQAMSGDRRLEPAVLKAVNYSLRAQNAGTGGWRYRPGDTGDTSQMGWQVMSLASAKKAGISIPDQTWNRVDRFLRSVRRGTFGGLASYRPDSPATTSMTAEALYCHLVLDEMSGLKLTEPAANEATNQILTALPSADRVNLYYWYYATLALHGRQHLSNEANIAWRTWNDAMTDALLSTQVGEGANAGSWETNTLWGGYGGRVYTTAIAAMCLEVYYRYAPAASAQTPSMADRSGWQPLNK